MDLNTNTVVLASAGTGKTRRLVERYIALLEDGADPLSVVAVTFTEKAAGEMRDRIRTAIEQKLKSSETLDHSKWLRILAQLAAAPISTIHGFCGLLLRGHGHHVGIDPSFTILDEQSSLDLARESAVETIRQEIRLGRPETEGVFGDLGLDALTESIVRGGYWLNSLGKPSDWLSARVDDQAKAAAEIERARADEIEKYGGLPSRIGELADEVEAQRKNRHPLRKRDDPRALLPQIGQVAGVPVARELARQIALALECSRLKKRAANALDFDDLLLGARDLLRDAPVARAYYQNRFRVLLVDEFQDTDEVQAEIICLLAGDPLGVRRFAPGKLFVVGDPKQSIFRFRRARVTVFVRTTKSILDDGGVEEHLQDNYRSAGPLVEFSNRLSEHVMDGEGNKKNQVPDGVDLSYRIRFSQEDVLKPASKASFLGMTLIAAAADTRAAAGREMEAEALARLLKQWKRDGTIATWREVAVLMRVMTNVGIYVDALEAHGIPVYVVQGQYFYRKSEVSDLIALLEFVLSPDDPVIRSIVMSSSLAGVTFDEQLEGRSSEVLEEILRPWIAERDRATAAEILEDVIRRTRFDAVLMAQKNGPQRVANVGKLIEITRDMARQGASALDDIVRRLRARAEDMSVRVPEAQVLGQDDEVVRILTVHQSKGLEFDVVVVPDLAAKGRGPSDRNIFSDRWGILAGASYGLHRKPLPHALILEAREEDEDQQFEEEKRLLYVAVTRARRMLVLGEGFATRGGPWQQWVEKLLETVQPDAVEKARAGKASKVRFRGRGENFVVDVVPAMSFVRPQQLALNIDLASVDVETRYRELLSLREELASREFKPQGVEMTPSELLAMDGCFRRFQWTSVLSVPEPDRESLRSGSTMRLGSAAHKALEQELRDGARLASMGLGELAAVFESQDWAQLNALSFERELPFIMRVQASGQDCFIRGRMDVVVPGALPRAIDYKFALWKPGAEDVYRTQMMAYCLALMKSFGTDRAVGEVWYLRSPMKVVRHEYTFAECEEHLTQLFGRYLSSLTSNDWPMAARPYCDRIACGFRPQCWDGLSITS